MPNQLVRGVAINYEIFGDHGPVIALTPGARRSYAEFIGLAGVLAGFGYRVLLHDRRNCGKSQLAFDASGSEHEIWADDLYHLCRELKLGPIFVGGASAGARLAILFCLRHPDAAMGMLLWRVTGGYHAATKLAYEYYGSLIALAKEGGMSAVSASPHFSECIRVRPEGRSELLRVDVNEFIRIMEMWSDAFIQAADAPVIGATEEQLRSLTIPICIVPGNDRVHNPVAAFRIAALSPAAQLHDGLVEKRSEEDLKAHWDPSEWEAAEPAMAAIFAEFLRGGRNANAT